MRLAERVREVLSDRSRRAPPPAAGASATCRAPHVALRLSPDGTIHACCVNDAYPLGRIGEDTVASVWQGTRLARLRTALDEADYSLGCGDCGDEYLTGDRLQTHAEQFDRFPQPVEPLTWPRRVEFALSNTCNLQCRQCNGDLSSAIRTRRERRAPLRSPYGDEFFSELRTWLPFVEVAVFIGGEPFLARECRRVWDLMIEMRLAPEVHVTTNGTVWDERVEHYVRSLRMNVAVSIDGVTSGVVEHIRSGADHASVIANRDRLLALTRASGSAFTLNHCLMVQNWHELGDFLLEADRLDVDVHVIPVMHPAAFSLLRLPVSELRPVVAALDRQDEALRGRLQRNAPVWDLMLTYLRQSLEHLEGRSVPVTVAPAPKRLLVSDLLSTAREELTTWSGRELMVVEVENGMITDADVPDWAGAIEPGAIVGSPFDALAGTMVERLGAISDVATEAAERTLVRSSCRIVIDGRQVSLRTAAVEWREGHALHLRVFYALGSVPR